MGKGSVPRKCQVSKEENDLRWDYAFGLLDIDEKEMRKRIKEIRKRTKKP